MYGASASSYIRHIKINNVRKVGGGLVGRKGEGCMMIDNERREEGWGGRRGLRDPQWIGLMRLIIICIRK